MRDLFQKGLLSSDRNATATNRMHPRIPELKYCDCLLIWTDIRNVAVMLSDLLNLTFNRSAHCIKVSDQCPLGLLLTSSE